MSDINDKVSRLAYDRVQPPTYNDSYFSVHSSTYAAVLSNACINVNRASGVTLDIPTQDAQTLAFGQ
jgi:hypothetical protein